MYEKSCRSPQIEIRSKLTYRKFVLHAAFNAKPKSLHGYSVAISLVPIVKVRCTEADGGVGQRSRGTAPRSPKQLFLLPLLDGSNRVRVPGHFPFAPAGPIGLDQ